MPKSKREALLAATWSEIARSGVHNVRIDQVAARAGVATSLIYYHFGSREGLLEATMSYADSRTASANLSDPPDGGWTLGALRGVLLADFDDGEDARTNATVWNELCAASVFDAGLAARVSSVTLQWTRDVAEAVRQGQAGGSIRPDVDALDAAEVLTTLVDGLILRWLSGTLDVGRARAMLDQAIVRTLSPLSGQR